MAHDVYSVALVVVSGYFLATVLANMVYFRLATRKARIKCGPFVSVILPARNEERSIARCVQSLLEQDYEDFEIVVVDDESTDATARIVTELAATDSRLRLVSGAPLPEKWLGKPFALSQGVAAATGEILVLTDADTVHEPTSVSWAVTNLTDHKADVLSGYLDQQYGTFGESLMVPVLYAMMMLVPFALLPRTKSPRLAFSVGQFVALRRSALEAVGGYTSIRDSITDDMSMAILMKEAGYRNVFLDAREAASCRLYRGYREAFHGTKRSIYSAVGGHPLSAIAVAAIVFAFIVMPALWALDASAHLARPATPVMISVMFFVTQWAVLAWDRNTPVATVIFYPLVFLGLATVLGASMLSTGYGRGVEWKGRLVRMPRNQRPLQHPKPAERF